MESMTVCVTDLAWRNQIPVFRNPFSTPTCSGRADGRLACHMTALMTKSTLYQRWADEWMGCIADELVDFALDGSG